jgi:mycothiol synthase
VFHIEPALPEDWPTALELTLQYLPEDQRPARVQHCLGLLTTGVLDPRGVFVARRDGAMVAAQVCVPLQGSACLFWLPICEDACADALVRAGIEWSRSMGCKLAQALARPDERERGAVLTRNGFRLITHIEQWGRDLLDLPSAMARTWRLERYRPELVNEFAATVARTYEGTLDCPELNGVRTIDEIMAGHRAQGKFHPDFWWLAFVDDVPAGVVLLTEMADGASWELAYLGVVPEYRGRGLARSLLTHAMHALSERPAAHVILAVDERNRPARRLYESLGFVQIESSDVYLLVL